MQLVLRQRGGLGNQLFQYAAARYYSRRYGAELRIAVDSPWNAVCSWISETLSALAFLHSCAYAGAIIP